MPARILKVPAHRRARARYLYEQTETPVQAIADHLGISRTTLFQRIKKWKWRPRLHRVPPLDRAAPAPLDRAAAPQRDPPAVPAPAVPAPAVPDPVRPERAAGEPAPAEMLRSVMRSVEQELAALDAIVGRLKRSKDLGQAERVARTLASLARTTREVMRLEPPPAPAAQSDGVEEDDPPYDIDSLRNDLLARLAGFVAGGQGRVPGDAPRAGAGDGEDDLGPVCA